MALSKGETLSGVGDAALARACALVERARTGDRPKPLVRTFFDAASHTASHVISDPETGFAAIADPVLDYDAASGRIAYHSAEEVVRHVEEHGLKVEWLLETHAHADHLSAAPWLQQRIGGQIAIGRHIVGVQRIFGDIFNAGDVFRRDGSQFDRLFDDGDIFHIGTLEAAVLHVPGHTPADVAYVIGDAVLTGDTIFMPDYGTARADFPGGDARQLYRSIRRLLSLPRHARLFLCHDYKAPGRDLFAWETTVGVQRDANVHVHDAIGEESFVAMRTGRDKQLATPRLLYPSVQVNMRGGRLPEPEGNGTRYVKIPLEAN